MEHEKDDLEMQMLLSSNRATTIRDLQEQEQNQTEARKNNGFTQLDDIGVKALEKLIERSPKAGNLFLRLARQMDFRGAIVASTEALAELGECDRTNVAKLLKLMTDFGLLRQVKQGGMRIIAINHRVAWRSFASGKQYALFDAKVMVMPHEIEDTDDFDIRRARALIRMAKKRKGKARTADPELPPPVGREAEDCEVID